MTAETRSDVTSNAPRRISDREVPIIITGYFMPTRSPNVPVLIRMPGTDDFIVVFSTREKLAETMTTFKIEHERVAIVTHGRELLDEIRAMNETGGRSYRIRLAVDPYKADNGRLRFSEALMSGDARRDAPACLRIITTNTKNDEA